VTLTTVALERYPFGKRFAVSIVDDTDRARLHQIAPVYACLRERGLLATKTVWPLRATASSGGYEKLSTDGDTFDEPAYRAFCESLHAEGFEIALHTVSGGDSTRDETIRG
jgi:hypothetical protein